MPTAADRELVVLDASVLVSVLIDPSAGLESAVGRLSGAALLAPAILPFEVANVMRRRRNRGDLSPAEADLAFEELRSFPVELWPFEVVAERAWQLGPNLSAYDAAYVALAELTGATLMTRDRRIAGAPGVRCRIDVV